MKKQLALLLFTSVAFQASSLSASAFQRVPQSLRQSWLGQKAQELAKRIDAAEITKDQAVKWLVFATGGILTAAAAAFFINRARKAGEKPMMWEVDPEEEGEEEGRVPKGSRDDE